MESIVLLDSIKKVSNKLQEPVTDISSLIQWKTDLSMLIDEIGKFKLPNSSTTDTQRHTSLDPIDWPSARTIAHQMLDASLDYMQSIRTNPIWRPMPSKIRTTLEQDPLPENGQSLANILHDITTYVLPYTKGNAHPRYWGWVTGAGTLSGVLADMISATLNINAASGTHCAAIIERTVIEWIRQLFGFPQQTAGGFLTSGTSMSTIVCLAAARQRVLTNVRDVGLVHAPNLVVYGSTETHSCIVKALELLGLGSQSFHSIPVDENFHIRLVDLRQTIDDDRKNGFIPFCIVGNAGTSKEVIDDFRVECQVFIV
jgi:aromatic-L-amino-acid/L-tryptophan decarboxylase